MIHGDEDDASLWRNSWMSGLPEKRQVYEAGGDHHQHRLDVIQCNTLQTAINCNTRQYKQFTALHLNSVLLKVHLASCALLGAVQKEAGGVLGLSER